MKRAPPRQQPDSEGHLPLPPALALMQLLWRLNHALERLSARMERSLGITAQQRMTLRCVGRYPGLTAGQLATQLHVDPGTVSAAIRRLERRGLLVRRRDQRDRRRVTLGLTASGRALDRPANGTVERAVERLLAAADGGDLQITRRTISTLTRLMEEERAPPEETRSPRASPRGSPSSA